MPTTFSFDENRYWLTGLTVGSLWSLQYQNYDGAGNVHGIGDTRPNEPATTQSFEYDTLDRLTTAIGPYGSIAYAYNLHGNRTTANGTTYSYYPGTLRLQSQGVETYTYDNNGNLLTAPNKAYTYTPRNMLATASVIGGATSYGYDADDWRIKKTSGGATTYFLRGPDGQLLTEWKNPGPSGETRDYIYAGSRLISIVRRPWSEVGDIYGTITPDGPPVTVTLSIPGQRAWLTVNAPTGQRVSLRGTNGTIKWQQWGCDVWVTLRKPDGSAQGASTCMEEEGFMDAQTLGVPGTYTVLVDPTGTATGNLTLTMYAVPPDFTATITPGGSPVTVPLLKPGQNAMLTVNAATGQRVSVQADGSIAYQAWGCDVWTALVKPNGTAVGQGTCMEPNGFIEATTLSEPGSYSFAIDPVEFATGTLTVTMYDVPPDVTGTIAFGTAVTVPITVEGQNATFTFAGTPGQRITLQGSGGITGHMGWGCDVWVTLTNPSGTAVTGSICMEGGGFLDVTTLPQEGIYSIVVDPQTTATGTMTLTLYLMPPDAGGALTIGGPAVPVSITTPGQVVALTVEGTANQQVTVRMTSNAISGLTTVRLLRPDGSQQASVVGWPGAFNMATQTLATTGTYTVVVDAPGPNTGTITVAVTSP